ncbi:DEAD/DEAH box helicase [Cochlodiniinecator piscidefendens]|uniref:DEAD/DEAH box helicase n=1 Tax=Cochlodiniinecator piscidefendens TaxID=2715756 RepID=UPI00140AE0D0|nr:DEAD/DEAH box helicase [Cochlodiniinecator piscidefendens]
MIKTLADALAKRSYDTLTPVQEAVTNPELTEADLLVSAQTGSGKTVGFGLAIAPTLLGDSDRFERAALPLGLVIAPTRELAMQVKRELDWLYEFAGVQVASCVGGMDMRDERRSLERGAHIVVATPGRLRDHIQRQSIDLSDIRAVVLDEADEMLDLGFREDLEFILGEAPETRRTLMFSATVPRAIEGLARSYQKDAVRISTVADKEQHADIEYRALLVAQRDIENAIINAIRFYEAPNAIVFCNTRAVVNRLTARLSNRGMQVVALSGELSQAERSHALQAMRDGRARVCVATDVAARGIDLPKLELVIHADLPSSSETLLHRSGRTGRAGRKGVSALIVPSKAQGKAKRLLKFAKLTADWGSAPSAQEVRARDEERLLSDPLWDQEVSADESSFAEKLVALHSPEKLAAAYLRLYQQRQSAPEDIQAVSGDAAAERKPREEFGPSKWMSLSVGRSENAEARWLLPMMCRAGRIDKQDLGAIRVQQNETFVELREGAVKGFLDSIGAVMELEDGVGITMLDKAPTFDKSSFGGPRGGGRPDFKGGGPRGGGHRGKSDRPQRDRDDRSERPQRRDGDKPYHAKPERRDHDGAVKPYKAKSDRPNRDGDKPYRAKSDKPYSGGDDRKAPRGDKPKRDFGDRPSFSKGGPRKEGGRKDGPRSEGKPFSKPRADRSERPQRAERSEGGGQRSGASSASKSFRAPKAGGKKPGGKIDFAGTPAPKAKMKRSKGGDALPRRKK